MAVQGVLTTATCTNYLQLEQTKLALSEPVITFPNQYHSCAPSANCIPLNPAYYGGLGVLQTLLAGTTAGREVDMITNNVKTPYSDQVQLRHAQ